RASTTLEALSKLKPV
ncbi:hypothetical protein, partial [Acinetobacter pittii]